MLSFENLLEKDVFVSVHNRNLQVLVTEMFKINRVFSSSITKYIYEPRDEHPYNFNFSIFCTASKHNISWRGRYIFLRDKG